MSPAGDGTSRPETGESTEPSIAELRETMEALIGMMSAGGISKLDLTFGSVSIRLRGNGRVPGSERVDALPLVPLDLPRSDDSSPLLDEAGHVITAPMIGTYYASPSPSEPPFVRLGDAVEIGQIVGIIEAMKIMNEIAADRAGVVAAILVDNGQAVEYGSPLLQLSPPLDTIG